MDKITREKLIKENMELVSTIARSYAEKTGIDIHELESYGYEGLLVGINKIDISKEDSLIKGYLYKNTNGYILKGIHSIHPYCLLEYYYKFLQAKKEVEEQEYTTLEEDISLLRNISNLMVERNNISPLQQKRLEQHVLLYMSDPLSQHKNTLVCPEETILSQSIKDNVQKEINQALNNLYFTEKYIITEIFGLNNREPKTVAELARELNRSEARIREILNKGIMKLKHPNNSKKLRQLLDEINNISNYVDYIDTSKSKLNELPKIQKKTI